ncbi:MAG: hypothetical protein WC969_02650 [Elusimicrobiota bacterium]|jgi:hypothetical protein
MPADSDSVTPLGRFAAAWGLFGVALLLCSAVGRMAPPALEGMRSGMDAAHWTAFALVCLLMGYGMGCRGLVRSFAPRVAARALHLLRAPTPVRAALAPFFCMSFFAAPARRLRLSWGLTATMIVLIVLVHGLRQPWHGIVDAGVCVGLFEGLAALAFHGVRDLLTGVPSREPEVC